MVRPVLCVTGKKKKKKEKKQATDAARSGPGAGVRPHEWIDSCTGRTLQKNLFLSAACYIVAICSCICMELWAQKMGALPYK